MRVKKFKQPVSINNDIGNAINTRYLELKRARKSNSPKDWKKYKLK